MKKILPFIILLISAMGCKTEQEKKMARRKMILAEMDAKIDSSNRAAKIWMDSVLANGDSIQSEIDWKFKTESARLDIMREYVKQGLTFKEAKAKAFKLYGDGSHRFMDSALKADYDKYIADSNSRK